MKLFCFPYSGGSSALFHKYDNVIGENIEIVPVDLDYHEEDSFKDVIKLLAESIYNRLNKEEPFILFGHSMGGVIAYEVDKFLCKLVNPGKIGLVISGMVPPSLNYFNKLDSNITQKKALEYSKQLGMDNLDKLPVEYLEFVIKKMNQDNNLLKRYESYDYIFSDGVGAVIYSEQELNLGEPEDWKDLLPTDTAYYKVKGNHFYLLDNFEFVTNVIHKVAEKLIAKEC